MEKILPIVAIVDLTGKSRTTIWRWVRAGDFPAPVVLGKNSVGWLAGEVEAWLESRPRVVYAPSQPTDHAAAAA